MRGWEIRSGRPDLSVWRGSEAICTAGPVVACPPQGPLRNRIRTVYRYHHVLPFCSLVLLACLLPVCCCTTGAPPIALNPFTPFPLGLVQAPILLLLLLARRCIAILERRGEADGPVWPSEDSAVIFCFFCDPPVAVVAGAGKPPIHRSAAQAEGKREMRGGVVKLNIPSKTDVLPGSQVGSSYQQKGILCDSV
jgi:hypothetical protein